MEKLCELADIPEGQAREFHHEGTPFFVVHRDGEYTAFVNWCPHVGVELNYEPNRFLDTEGYYIICANHGALFETQTGLCVSGPCVGGSLIPIACQAKPDGLYIGDVPRKRESP